MKQFDFVIIGFGIAGATIARELTLRGIHVLVLDSGMNTATAIAGGTVHPAVLRYYNKVWRADEFWPKAKSFYKSLEDEWQVPLIQTKGLVRVFASIGESSQWQKKRKDPFWHDYLNPLNQNESVSLPNINAPYGYGMSDDFWRFDPAFLLNSYRQKLIETNQYRRLELTFDSEKSLFSQINNLGYITDRVILAQGYQQAFWCDSAKVNPIVSKQGQYLIIECPGLQLTEVLKSKFFIIPLGGDRYQVGATYPRASDPNAFEEAQKGILADLELLLKLPYRIIDYWTGTRPGTKDRHPILGALNSKKNIYVFNGLNSRGLLMAPLLAHWLADFILEGKALPSEVSINRFF